MGLLYDSKKGQNKVAGKHSHTLYQVTVTPACFEMAKV